MDHYAGIDVSLECSSVCLVDGTGKILREAKVASEPEALIAWFRSLGLAAGSGSGWRPVRCRNGSMRAAGRGPCGRASGDAARSRCLQIDAGEDGSQRRPRDRAVDAARLVPAGALQVGRGAGDARDADGAQAAAIQAARCREQPARRTARLRSKGRHDHRARVRRTHPRARCRPSRTGVGGAGAARSPCRAAARVQWPGQAGPEARQIAASGQSPDDDAVRRSDRGAHLCRGVDDPKRFRSSKATGRTLASPRRNTNRDETDYTGRISKIGDASVREALYQAAHVMLTKPVKNCSALKSWAMRIARRAGMRKAKVALARKLAVDPAPHACRQQTVQSDGQGHAATLRRSINRFRAGHDTRPLLSEVPTPGRWIRSGRHPGSGSQPRFRRLAGRLLMHPIRRRPPRRSRTEASPRRVDYAKRD